MSPKITPENWEVQMGNCRFCNNHGLKVLRYNHICPFRHCRGRQCLSKERNLIKNKIWQTVKNGKAQIRMAAEAELAAVDKEMRTAPSCKGSDHPITSSRGSDTHMLKEIKNESDESITCEKNDSFPSTSQFSSQQVSPEFVDDVTTPHLILKFAEERFALDEKKPIAEEKKGIIALLEESQKQQQAIGKPNNEGMKTPKLNDKLNCARCRIHGFISLRTVEHECPFINCMGMHCLKRRIVLAHSKRRRLLVSKKANLQRKEEKKIVMLKAALKGAKSCENRNLPHLISTAAISSVTNEIEEENFDEQSGDDLMDTACESENYHERISRDSQGHVKLEEANCLVVEEEFSSAGSSNSREGIYYEWMNDNKVHENNPDADDGEDLLDSEDDEEWDPTWNADQKDDRFSQIYDKKGEDWVEVVRFGDRLVRVDQVKRAIAFYRSTAKGFRKLESMMKKFRWIKTSRHLQRLTELESVGEIRCDRKHALLRLTDRLEEWANGEMAQGRILQDLDIQQMACRLNAEIFHVDSFTASASWVRTFKKRRKIGSLLIKNVKEEIAELPSSCVVNADEDSFLKMHEYSTLDEIKEEQGIESQRESSYVGDLQPYAPLTIKYEIEEEAVQDGTTTAHHNISKYAPISCGIKIEEDSYRDE